MVAVPSPRYRFDRFELVPGERSLLAGGEQAKIGGRAFDMLVALVERHDRVVGKRELMDLVWPQLVVEENNLQAQVVALRKLLGPAAIATVPGRGYRFTLPVEHSAMAATDAATPADEDDQPRAATRHNLPLWTEPLIGRERELEAVGQLVAASHLVTVTGPGGVGKSRLVVEVARRRSEHFADGAWLVELAALGAPERLASTICATLGITVPPHADAAAELAARLATKRTLLVLDNCEHLVEALAELLAKLLAAAPQLHVLVSSQELLGVAGEQVFRLPSLAVPAEATPSIETLLARGATRLFVERARAADAAFALDARTAPVVATICRRLDGIPLALEMAAARVPLLGVEALAQRLDERFRVLTAGKRTALPRQRTLQATLDWSYGLLADDEKAVLRRLGVFAGSFSLAAAVAVAADELHDEFDVIETLAALCDRSLLRVDPTGGATRYALLETTAAYATARLAEANETAATSWRHAVFYRTTFARCFEDWTVLSDRAFSDRYARDIDNLRVAIGWALGTDGDDETAIALVGSAARVFVRLSLFAEIEALLDSAFARLAAHTPAALEAELWLAMSLVYGQRHQQRTIESAARAAALYRCLGDAVRLGCALHVLGTAHAAERDEEAEAIVRESQPLLEATRRPRLLGMASAAFALLFGAQGRAEEATRYTRSALQWYEAAGAESGVLTCLGSLADQTWMQGDLDAAIAAARDAYERQRQSPFAGRVTQAYAAANLFGMLVERGDLDEARALGRDLLPELCDLRLMHGWSDHFASYLARAGRAPDAVRLVGWADTLRQSRALRRQPNEQRARDITLRLARQCAPDLDVPGLLVEGAAMSEAQAHRAAMP